MVAVAAAGEGTAVRSPAQQQPPACAAAPGQASEEEEEESPATTPRPDWLPRRARVCAFGLASEGGEAARGLAEGRDGGRRLEPEGVFKGHRWRQRAARRRGAPPEEAVAMGRAPSMGRAGALRPPPRGGLRPGRAGLRGGRGPRPVTWGGRPRFPPKGRGGARAGPGLRRREGRGEERRGSRRRPGPGAGGRASPEVREEERQLL